MRNKAKIELLCQKLLELADKLANEEDAQGCIVASSNASIIFLLMGMAETLEEIRDAIKAK